MDITENKKSIKIGEMVAQNYRIAEVFKKFGMDFCCGGNKTLNEACSKQGINVSEVVEAIEKLDLQKPLPNQNFQEWDLDALTSYIVNTHHKYVNETIPVLEEFGSKVARVHGEGHPEVVDIFQHFLALAQELRMHMHKEEVILFPYINHIASAKHQNHQLSSPPFGSVTNPIAMMEMEHESAGETMTVIRELSNNFNPPESACNTYRVLYFKLQEFEEDLHKHIHIENNILFPRAKALETELLG